MENVLQKFASGMGIVLAEYIERDALLDDISAAVKHRGMGEIIGKTLMRYVKRQPAADVAPVVRCKDCKHLVAVNVNGKGIPTCRVSGMEVAPDEFCSRGEKGRR